jgi:hypothetical protein
MVYWHVERKSVCIYWQVTSTTASEAASMIEGLPRALDLHEAAVAGADDVHVGLGLDVFLVGEVEQGHATTLPAATVPVSGWASDQTASRTIEALAADAAAALKAIDTTAPATARAVVSGREMGQPRIAVVSRVNWRWPISL